MGGIKCTQWHLSSDTLPAGPVRRTFLIRDILHEMALNGVPPDAKFLEAAMQFAMRTQRVGDCFYYYAEMVRRGMQPRARAKAHLVSVLARAGHIEAASKVLPCAGMQAPPCPCSAFRSA